MSIHIHHPSYTILYRTGKRDRQTLKKAALNDTLTFKVIN